MAFMEPQITKKQSWVNIDGNKGGLSVPLDCWEGFDDDGKPANTVEVCTEDCCYNAGEYTVEIVEGFGARLSAPGYMDCTEWVVFDTEENARAYLVSTYELCPEDLHDHSDDEDDRCEHCDDPDGSRRAL